MLFVITFVVNFAARAIVARDETGECPDDHDRASPAETQRHEHVPLRHPRLPRWAPLLVAAMARVAAAGLLGAQPRLGRRRHR